MIKWVRPCGTEIETADGSNLNDWAESKGWKRIGVAPVVAPKPVIVETKENLKSKLLNDIQFSCDKDLIASSVEALTGKSLDKRGKTETVRQKAIALVMGDKDGNTDDSTSHESSTTGEPTV